MAFPGKRLARRLLIAALVLAVLWGAASVALYAAMRQPPESFGAFMTHVPMVSMLVLPFELLWNHARAGHLRVGDRAPDFRLPLLNGTGDVALSGEFPLHPVVLVFGSYT